MTPAIYSYVWRPKFVFWLSVVVATLVGCALIVAFGSLKHGSIVQQAEPERSVPTDTVLKAQVNEIFTRVRNIETLAIKTNAKTDLNTDRLNRLEQKK